MAEQTKKELVLDYINNPPDMNDYFIIRREDWYCEEYAITHTFSKEEIERMSEKEIDNLYRLAHDIAGAFY